MSQLVDLYNSTKKLRPMEARTLIPGGGTDFFDRDHKFAEGFTVGRDQLSPTEFTEAAQQEYNTEKANFVPPLSYDPATPLHRYTPETPFAPAGQPKS